jgi:hypothetical protein
MELDRRLGISRATLLSFVSHVSKRMLDNPYHNWFHVCDVVQVFQISDPQHDTH